MSGLGPHLYLLWFAELIAAIVLASIHFYRRSRTHSLQGVGALIGGLLSWAWISWYIGVMEQSTFPYSPAYFVTMLIGCIGVGLFAQAFWRLRRAKPVRS